MSESPLQNRYVAHLDMDAFYASVELLRYPDLHGRAVAIGGGSDHQPDVLADGSRRYATLREYVGRGVITTSTYAARALGVFSGMGIMKAAKLAPDAILLPTDFEAYRHYSRLFKAAVASVSPHIEDRGIDEIYIELSQEFADREELSSFALRIKKAVNDATGLSCSIGVASNKLLAKICSDLEKPNGLTILSPADLVSRIWPLSVSKINGIGPKAAEKLALLNIRTIAELAETDPGILQDNFGRSYGAWLYNASHGIDERPVVTYSEPKSLSRETTFERDLHAMLDRPILSAIFTKLCERLAGDLQRKGYIGRTVGIKLRFTDFSTVTRDVTLPASIDDADAIRRAAGECLRRISLHQRLRLLGVRVSALSKKGVATESQLSQPGQLLSQGDLFGSGVDSVE
ncbi:DNA polymerase IV [Glaciimonas sp. GG7]